jgi:hypothetical protein
LPPVWPVAPVTKIVLAMVDTLLRYISNRDSKSCNP